MRSYRQAGLILSIVLALVVPLLLVFAQSYPTHRGNNQRTGVNDADPKLSNPGRSFLRWWDPIKSLRDTLDNWEVGTTAVPPAEWFDPTSQQASNVITEPGQPVTAPDYRYALAVPSAPLDNTTPLPGYQLRTFTWAFPQFATTTSFALYVNIPVGATDIDPGAGVTEGFQQRYFVYLIDGVVNVDNPGQPIVQVVDTYANGGGMVRLGNNGNATDVVFQDDNSGPITITLLNTVPRDNQGQLTDTRQNIVVYADAAVLTRGFGGNGSYVASPVVGELTVNAGALRPWRVVSARNEPITTQVNSRVLDFNLGNIRSYGHNGAFLNVGDDGTGRANRVWTWPARAPWEDTAAEQDRYAQEKRNFILGRATTTSVPPLRAYHNIYVDNESVGFTYNALAWQLNPGGANNKGINYLTMPTQATTVGVERAIFAPNLGLPKNGEEEYELYLWVPGDGALAQQVRVEVYEGGIVDPDPNAAAANRTRIDVDQSVSRGWVRLRLASKERFKHRTNAPLYVAITNFSLLASDAGKLAYADMVRFVKVSDLSVTSTTVMTKTKVRVNGNLVDRDVVIAAYENGRIYCLDAEGNADGTTNVYWVYPSEMPDGINDPNWVNGEDGPDGIAENPIGFDMTSALVQSVETSPGTFEDLLYVGSRNGRVYCIEMEGRGDGVANVRYGTTRRRWSYPNDWPSATRVLSDLGPIVGSVSYNKNAGGQQTIYVPTVQGRLYALDAVGNPATKTTTVNWSYPLTTDPTIGPIRTSPAVRFGRVYFGTGEGISGGNNTFYAVNETTHTPDWTFTGTVSNPTLAFNESSPAVVPATDVNYVASPGGPMNGMPNTVFVANTNESVYALNADTGALVWETPEIKATAIGSLTFTYMRVFNKTGLVLNPPGAPVVVVPSIDGHWTALFAHVDDLNVRGNNDGYSRTAWGYGAEGDKVISSVAVGGQYAADNYAWMYGCDNLGYLYAWNDDPGVITPGEPPGIADVPPNEADTDGALDSIVRNGKIALLTPNDYDGLAGKLRNNTLRYTDITTALSARPVRRVSYEYGEQLYYVVYDIPSPTGLPAPLNTYSLEFTFNTPNSPSSRRPVNVQRIPITQGAEPNGVAFISYALLGAGGNAMSPGRFTTSVRALVQSRNISRLFPNTAYNPQYDLRLANPMALITRKSRSGGTIFTDAIGTSLDAADPENVNNGNLVGLVNPTTKTLIESFGPDVNSPADDVSHGQTASAKLFVIDRSCMTLLYGPERGLQNVRFAVNDLSWNVTNEADNYGVIKPLDPNGVAAPNLFPNMEELPVFFPNISLDYPDIRRESLKITRDVFGGVDNPMFAGVGLEPPKVAAASKTAYRGIAYNNQLVRVLENTEFLLNLDVAKYQPPSRAGYTGQQAVYVDANQPGRQFSGGVPNETYRAFDLYSDVGVDERLRVGTPTIDLGSLPAGGGYLPIAPFALGTPFSPWIPAYQNFFQRFSVFNEGNVNMLNVRMAQRLFDQDGNVMRTIRLGSPGLNELAWLDATRFLHSDLDPRFAPAPLNGHVILQKARPGGTASRLSVNPERLANPNLGVVASNPDPQFQPGPLLNPAQFEPGDPKVGVTAPIGAPVGGYQQQMYVFEDRDYNEPAHPALGPDSDYDPITPGNQFDAGTFEPWAEPGFLLKFNVRETRLTNVPSSKSAAMIDNLPIGNNEQFYWPNAQPAGLRDGNGNLIIAFASPRQDNAGPGWASKLRTEADMRQQEQWRIYLATVDGTNPSTVVTNFVESAIRDLYDFTPFDQTPGTGRFFRQEIGPFPNAALPALFNPGPNATIEPNSMNFGGPSFPTHGVFDPSDPVGANGKPASTSAYMAFVGEATKRTARGDREVVSDIFISNVNFGANGALTVTPPEPMGWDTSVRKSKPSIIQVGNRAYVFFTSTANGLGQINYAIWTGSAWSGQPRSINLGNGFESVGAPSVSARLYRGIAGPGFTPGRLVFDFSFTAKLRGRAQAEVFYGRMNSQGNGDPNQVQQFGSANAPKVDGLIYDPANGTYWAPGVDWVLGGQINNEIDILQQAPNGTTSSVVVANSGRIDESARTISFDTIFGGKAYLDAANGSIKFTGGLVPRSAVFGIRYVPRFLRLNSGLGANYRGAAMNFDEHFISEYGFWATPGPGPVDAALSFPAAARNDRFVFTYARTSGDGSTATRPFIRTYRFGVQLPTAVLTDNNGVLTRFKVTIAGQPAPIYYQIDPANGRVYFMGESENRQVSITYDGVDNAGRPTGAITVAGTIEVIPEGVETAIPIEQVANESAVGLALDPLNQPFNSQNFRRPDLYWLFWTSTRAGAPDLYFQTIAPRHTPLPRR
ncbi:MAG: PQQ-binding-like beta-propeller repeat protein [Fimbriimonadaceae bacterium]|nr:PQQ-binding-like beta-propeller repeat protein [Fimbriimonadaceae bacterium]